MTDKLFTIDNIEVTKSIIKTYISDYNYVNIYHSTLGGNDNISIILIISLDKKEDWQNNILENSRYIKLHIDNTGYIELCSQSHDLKLFRAGQCKSICKLTDKIRRQIKIREA